MSSLDGGDTRTRRWYLQPAALGLMQMPKVVGLEQLVGKLGVVDPLCGRHSCLHAADGQSWKARALSNTYLPAYLPTFPEQASGSREHASQ